MPTCVNCGSAYRPPVYRTAQCVQCGSDLKTCRNCLYFLPGAPNDCRESSAEPVSEKDKANFCGWFSPAEDAGAGPAAGAEAEDSADAARAAFRNLFSDD